MKGIAFALMLASFNAFGSLITLDPEDYRNGTKLNELSPHLKISRGNGLPVYSAEWQKKGIFDLSGMIDSIEPLGNKIFSFRPDYNSEWMYDYLTVEQSHVSNINLLRQHSSGSLILDFYKPVNNITIYTAELFQDAGWGSGSDPLLIFLYDRSGNLIHYGQEGMANEINYRSDYTPPTIYNPFSYTVNHFSFPEISHVAISGFSEPTTIGKIEFTTSTIPEPNSIILFSLLLPLLILKTRPIKF